MYESICVKRCISVFVCVLLILSAFTLSSFAQVTLIDSNMSSSSWSWASYSDRPTLTYDSSLDRNKFEMNANTDLTVRLTALATSDVYINHSYKLTFEVWGHFEDYIFQVHLVTKEDINTESTHILCTINQNLAHSDNSYTTVTIDFSPSAFVNSINSMALDFVFAQQNNATTSRNLYIKNLSLIDVDNDSGFWSSLFDKLTELKNSINSWFVSSIGSIGSMFSNLWDNISTAFSNLTSSVGQFFIDLGDDIADFFDMLKDYILYFQHPVELNEDGVPVDEYGEPIYENIFDIPDFFETLDGWIEQLETAKTDVDTAANQGIANIQNVISPLSQIISRVPFITIFLTFALAVIVIKKVIG